MSRPLRIEYPGAFYHVMNRGLNRNAIFLEDELDRHLFKETIGEAIEKWKIRVHAFSLMGNHYHLLIETPVPTLSRAMRHIDGLYTQRFNRRYHRDGPLFRGRFKSIVVEAESYLLELVRYIHLNGVRAKLFPSPQVDMYSSHWDYLHPEQATPWLEQSRVLSCFADQPQGPREALHRYVLGGISEELERVLARKRWPAVLGVQSFISLIREKYLRNQNRNRELPQKNALLKARIIPPEVISAAVNEIFNDATCTEKERKWANVFLLKTLSFLTYKEIGLRLGGMSYKSVQKFFVRNDFSASEIVLRVRERIGADRMSNVAT